MRRRVLGVIAALVLAGVGTFLVLSYARDADQRALADQEAVEVLVVADTISAGEPAGDIGRKVETALVPAQVRAVGSVASLDELQGQVAAVDLLPGEQVVSTRFVTEEELEELDDFEVPAGLLQVTLSLEPERAVGGTLEPGDHVAFVASFEPFAFNAIEPTDFDSLVGLKTLFISPPGEEEEGDAEGTIDSTLKTPNATHIVLHKLLVTAVQVERLPAEPDREDAAQEGVELALTGNLLVTLAASAPDVEKIIFTAEHGTAWLAAEPEAAPETGTQIQTRGSIYR